MLKHLFTRVLILFLAAVVVGAGIQVLAQQDPGTQQQMEMMKKMMMNRPAAMKTADDAIQTQKRAATSQGQYSCCLKQACDHCALKMGQCPCRQNLMEGMAGCNECKGVGQNS
ncbi:MAG: hypothetical protein AB7P22_16305, partial [Vicinamibacterales bacterium]